MERIAASFLSITRIAQSKSPPFHRAHYSQKLNGPALKYELAILIETYNIVHVNGPSNASEIDTTIFWERLMGLLCKDECVEFYLIIRLMLEYVVTSRRWVCDILLLAVRPCCYRVILII
jgi:hypothetical protein